MFLVCVIMRRMYPLQDFDVWFWKSGKKLLATAKAADAKEDLEDELLGEGEEVDDEVIGPDEASPWMTTPWWCSQLSAIT